MPVLRIRINQRPRGGVLAYLPVLLMVVLMPVIAWFVLDFINKNPESEERPPKEKKVKAIGAPSGLAVPVISEELGFVRGRPRRGEFPRFGATNSIAANSTSLEEMIITLADEKSVHHAVTQVHLVGRDTDAIIRGLNGSRANKVSFYERVTRLISSKTLKEVQAPGFRTTLKAEIRNLCNEFLGEGLVDEVVISKFLFK